MFKFLLLIPIVIVLTLSSAIAPVQAKDAPTTIDLTATCNPVRQEIILAWSADITPLLWIVARNEQIIASVAGRGAQADVLYTYRDPGVGGEYTVSGGDQSATVTIQCASMSGRAR